MTAKRLIAVLFVLYAPKWLRGGWLDRWMEAATEPPVAVKS